MSLFKLRKPARKLSDEEWVEAVRRATGKRKSWRRYLDAIYLVAIVGWFLLSLKMLWLALDQVTRLDASPVLVAYLVGGMSGGIFGYFLMQAVFLNLNHWTMKRHFQIMIKSWDRARELEAFIEKHSLTPPPAGSAKS